MKGNRDMNNDCDTQVSGLDLWWGGGEGSATKKKGNLFLAEARPNITSS